MRFLSGVFFAVVLCVAGLVAAGEADDEASPSKLSAVYDQGFRFATGDNAFALRINGLLQIRYTYVDYDPAIRFNQEDWSNFFVRRARLYFTGHAGSPKFTYLLHIQLEPNAVSENDGARPREGLALHVLAPD